MQEIFIHAMISFLIERYNHYHTDTCTLISHSPLLCKAHNDSGCPWFSGKKRRWEPTSATVVTVKDVADYAGTQIWSLNCVRKTPPITWFLLQYIISHPEQLPGRPVRKTAYLKSALRYSLTHHHTPIPNKNPT